ncbi:MAG TPA: helix-turn-helix transcriptional regulator [Thermoanaerobaculia bacterium]|nr:helix-turn-helix transcriptional regulator [Thermoanaerobaculia bacterium]
MTRKVPAFGSTLRFLRVFRGKSAGDLAQAAQVSPSLISEYENGTKTLYRDRLEALLDLLDVPPEAIDGALFTLELAGPAGEEGPASPGDPSPEERRSIGRAAARIGASVAREIRTGLTAAVRAARLEEDRRRAGEVWDVLRQLTPRERRTVVEVAGEHLGWAVCERLCEESAKAGADKAERAVEIAGLALRVAEQNPGPESTQLQGYAWAFVGNARRVQGNLPDADRAFVRSREMWQKGEAAGPTPLDETRILDLEASLRQYQGRFDDTLQLLGHALRSVGHPTRLSKLLAKEAAVFEMIGQYEKALYSLKKAADLIQTEAEPRLLLVIRFNMAVNLLYLQRYTEAEAVLPQIRAQAVELGNGLDLTRLLWLEGRAVAGLGKRDDALTIFCQVQSEFTARQIAYDAALVSLELAVLYLEARRTREVKDLAHKMLWIFRSQGVHREALAALKLFCEAAQQETATEELARRVFNYLEKARRAPELRFEGC